MATEPKRDVRAEFAALRAEVDALTEAERIARRERLGSDRALWTVTRIAHELGLSRSAVTKMRNKYLRTGKEAKDALIPPAPDVDSGSIRQPGDTSKTRGASPFWYAGDVRRWMTRWERADEDFVPRAGGRKPSGRPPRQRDPELDELDVDERTDIAA